MNLMEIWHGLLLGIIQGATEFLPISSSGHIFLAESWLGLTPDLHFAVSAHAASLLAVILIYRYDILKMLHGAAVYFHDPSHHRFAEGRLAWQLILATACTVVVALLIEPYFEHLLALPWVAGTLIITGLLIIVSEKFRPAQEYPFSWRLAVFLGLVQGLAVIPGISRSGLTIALLILLGLNRQQSARISFLLSIPTILGALVFTLKDEWGQVGIESASLAGCVASFVTAVLAIYWMKALVERHWIWFAPYCLLLGGGILAFIFLA